MPLDKSDYVSGVWKDSLFAGKVVFATGGSGTICSAQVRALVHLGADACIVGRNAEKAERVAEDIASARSGAKVLGLGNIDVRDPASLSKAIDTCVKELGSLDLLIVGAAGNFLAPISQLSPNAFKSVIDIDVLGSYNTAKLALPHLVASAKKHNNKTCSKTAGVSPGGRIIFVSATIHYTSMPLQAHVAAAKAGIDALSNSIAIEYGPLGLTSNIIAPGPIRGTEGMERLAKSARESERGRTIPAGRWGDVKDIANATVFLFSDAADYVTATGLVVDGGAWRTNSESPGGDFKYPDFLLSGDVVSGVGGMKKEKASKL